MGACAESLWFRKRFRSEQYNEAMKRYLAHTKCLKCSLNERINEQFFLFNCLRLEDVISQIIFIVKVDIVPLCYYLLPLNYESLVPCKKFLYLYRSGILFGHIKWCFFP